MATDFVKSNPRPLFSLVAICIVCVSISISTPVVDARTLRLNSISQHDDSLPYIWPLPSDFTFGNDTVTVDPDLSLAIDRDGGDNSIVRDAFERHRAIIFEHSSRISKLRFRSKSAYDISKLRVLSIRIAMSFNSVPKIAIR